MCTFPERNESVDVHIVHVSGLWESTKSYSDVRLIFSGFDLQH